MPTSSDPRPQWMGLLARAPEGRAAALLDGTGVTAEHSLLSAPQIGSVMVRGRTGATGAPFNLGEMTVTRCAVQLDCGTVGHGYVQGRRKADALTAALLDGLLQTDAADQLHQAVLTPLQDEETARRSKRAAKAAATKVEFFTLARGQS